MNPSDSTSLIESPHLSPSLRWRGFGKNGDRGRWPVRVKTSGQDRIGRDRLTWKMGRRNKFRGVKIQRIYVAVAVDDRSSPMENATGVNRRWLLRGCLIIEKCTRMDCRGGRETGWDERKGMGRKLGIDIWLRIDPMEKLLKKENWRIIRGCIFVGGYLIMYYWGWKKRIWRNYAKGEDF